MKAGPMKTHAWWIIPFVGNAILIPLTFVMVQPQHHDVFLYGLNQAFLTVLAVFFYLVIYPYLNRKKVPLDVARARTLIAERQQRELADRTRLAEAQADAQEAEDRDLFNGAYMNRRLNDMLERAGVDRGYTIVRSSTTVVERITKPSPTPPAPIRSRFERLNEEED